MYIAKRNLLLHVTIPIIVHTSCKQKNKAKTRKLSFTNPGCQVKFDSFVLPCIVTSGDAKKRIVHEIHKSWIIHSPFTIEILIAKKESSKSPLVRCILICLLPLTDRMVAPHKTPPLAGAFFRLLLKPTHPISATMQRWWWWWWMRGRPHNARRETTK